MYGTIARMQPKPGAETRIVELFREWERDLKPRVKGALHGFLYRLDKGSMMAVAVFESREAYMANASNPEQDAWYRKLREQLEADPEWNDGEILASG
jgi:hypothetical protein